MRLYFFELHAIVDGTKFRKFVYFYTFNSVITCVNFLIWFFGSAVF